MNHSDDEIFGRNIDQLDRQTPRYHLSEEENDSSADELDLKKEKHVKPITNVVAEKMPATPPKPTPSVASVQPYGRTLGQSSAHMLSPSSVKKNILPSDHGGMPPPAAAQNLPPQHLPPHAVQQPLSHQASHTQQLTTQHAKRLGVHKPQLNQSQLSQGQSQPANHQSQPTFYNSQMYPNNHYPSGHPSYPGVNPASHTSYPGAGKYPPNVDQQASMAPQFVNNQVRPSNPVRHTNTNFGNQYLNSSQNSMPPAAKNIPPPDQAPPCYCADCFNSPPPPQNLQAALSQQMAIKPERQKIEDEILLRQRELDSCWQEDEVDCPRDFTAIDRKKEKCYAEWSSDVSWKDDGSGHSAQMTNQPLSREIKTAAVATSAQSTVVSRDHPTAGNSTSYSSNTKTKAKAVVTPFARSQGGGKKVNINTVVSQFYIKSQTEEPDEPQDLATQWPQSEMGSRIPSSERINLSPLCMSGVPSGTQTPLEPGTGQKPVEFHTQNPASIKVNEPVQRQPESSTKGSIIEKFRGNEQYKRPYDIPVQPSADSVKNYTSSRWLPQSEMGSRIPSSERISLSPLTMSGNPSTLPSGTQTPAEPNSANIPLNAQMKSTFGDRQMATPAEKKKHVILPPETIPEDNIQDYSAIPQSELTSRVPSSERINLSPLCQSAIPSGRQTPEEDPEPVVDKEGVKLRGKKSGNNASATSSEHLETLMSRMNIGTGPPGIPRFEHSEEDSVKNYGQPELTSRIASYESLNFSPWSGNTSGIVTPCDHSSLSSGAKPLHAQQYQQQQQRKQLQTASSQDEKKTLIENHHYFQSGQGSHHQTSYPPCHQKQDVTTCDNQLLRKSTVDNSIDGVSPVDEQEQSQNLKAPPNVCIKKPGRRDSVSSTGSTCSNRTDISTVVNAPTSMHNTAPASPDPAGSEVSDSDISDPDHLDASSDLPPSYSQPISPSLSNEGSISNDKRQPLPHKPILRNRNEQSINISQQPVRNISQPNKVIGLSKEFKSTSDNECENNPVKTLIEMAKEQFPSKTPERQQNWNKEPSYNNNMQQIGSRPSIRKTGKEQSYSNPPPPVLHGHGYSPNHPNVDAQRYAAVTYRNPNFQNTQLDEAYLNYPQAARDIPDRPYPSSHMREPRFQHPGNRSPFPLVRNQPGEFFCPQSSAVHPNMIPRHRMQPIPEGQPAHLYRHQRPPGNATYPHDRRYNRTEQYQEQVVPFSHQEFVNYNRQMYHDPQLPAESYHFPHHFPHPQHQQQAIPAQNVPQQTMSQNQPPHIADQEHDNTQAQPRSFSVTSLEPNHDSPPHSESLDTVSVVSFASMAASNQNTTKADMMSSLLSMLGTHDPDDMARTLLSLSGSSESCSAMRQSGCLPLIVGLLHNSQDENINWGARQRAGLALHNIVHANSSDRHGKREIRVLRLLEIIRTHSEAILSQRENGYRSNHVAPPLKDHGPGPAVAAIMKLSFEEEHKNTICELGGLQTIGEILAVDFIENNTCQDLYSIALRKYAGMALINLTYNDSKNKAILCTMSSTLRAITGQLRLTEAEDLVQVFAGIIRNISWRPDNKTQRALQKVNAIRALLIAVQKLETEVCIRTVLSAVWNLSAHNSENKEEVCRTPGSLKYLAFALNYPSQTQSFDVAENAGGILRNVSSHIALNMEYRRILRQEGCLQTLVAQLRSPSTRVISNSCGVLWNLSARCAEDQQALWDLGAVSVLKTLIHVKHKSISAGAAAALRNLLAVTPGSGTDTESNMSFHQRSNSLPNRGKRLSADRRYRSTGAAERKRSKNKTEHDNESKQRLTTHNNPEHLPPSYNEVADIIHHNTNLPGLHGRHPSSSSRVFFPADSSSYLVDSSRIHKRFESSSSCSSFSHSNDNNGGIPVNSNRLLSNNSHSPSDSKEEQDNVPTYQSNEAAGDPISDHLLPNNTDCNPYEDATLSKVKDAVLMYVATPKLKSKKKKQKLPTPRSLKSQKNKKSIESVFSSKDSLCVDPEKLRDNKKDNIWIKTKEKRTLNKSHSSDLAVDKNITDTHNKRSTFELYSMSKFPDRVASDQCLTVTERYIRDNIHESVDTDIHNASWSSFDVNNEERLMPNHQGGNFTPNIIPKRMINPYNYPRDDTSVNSSTIYHISESGFHQQLLNKQMHSAPFLYQTQTAESNETSSKKSGKLKSLLKNPLKKSESKSKKSIEKKTKEKR